MSDLPPPAAAESGHVPVMLAEVLAMLAPRAGASYCDGTFGGGGYAAAILDTAPCTLFAIDRDPDAIARGAALAARFAGRLHLLEGRFGEMAELLAARGVAALDGVVLDLGVSSFQLDEAARGFSFRADGPLDMRMEKAGKSAADLVNQLDDSELADMLFTLGEERHSRRIARAIVAARREAPITTTLRLAEIIRSVTPRDPSGIDRATRSFQALRLAVNDELGEVERGLDAAAGLLAPGGRLVVVAFHSLEDRIVKRFMARAAGRQGAGSRHDPAALAGRAAPAAHALLTPRALRPGEDETRRNPRARSARLRALERLPPGTAAA
ncbi:16S rRNA (cytosine(1402)-N(4))-methyltransferase RsmH [Paracraurococcus ruber]|uniref:Ribosomal RNA small subunit methyltransferase H n=1 Tax=Paracraurococcus ruber TaxID=77675 RepID=A0ABS1D607_9PROT|nr:16S rRNA (cytosine(1402)-N(4))-methyltransferase RsmH [Paracraurococcus ruber]MBK1661996.1 16S rRNA (cytosine(1402)-N(4))-methyltransferase [Paracraurococcus ruber]TDG16757.1 16S rRNA (cytosine(1402)-N(4))-methyltransferase RsmH [Paracraurococcus ruber]